MPTNIDEQTIPDSLRQVLSACWGEVLRFLTSLNEVEFEPPIRTGGDLRRSVLIGLCADREDLGGGHESARELRCRVET